MTIETKGYDSGERDGEVIDDLLITEKIYHRTVKSDWRPVQLPKFVSSTAFGDIMRLNVPSGLQFCG